MAKLPAANADGNFIIGPTHTPAAEMTVQTGVPQGTVFEFTMESTDSKIYPGIVREAETFGTADPNDPAKMIVTTSHPAPYTRQGGGVCSEAVCGGDGGAVYRGRGWAGPGAVYGAR